MLKNSRLPLKTVLNALDISYKEYFKYFSVLFPLVYRNEIVIKDNISYLDPYEVDFSYLDFNKTEYTLRFGPDFQLSHYADNVYFLLKQDVDYKDINFISKYPQDTNIVSNVSTWKIVIEEDNEYNKRLLKLLKEIVFTLERSYEVCLYQFHIDPSTDL